MLIKYPALTSQLNKTSYRVFVLTGAESFLLNEAALQIKHALAKQSEYDLKILDIDTTSDWSMLIAQANSYSLFYENVVIDARLEKKTIDAKAKEIFSAYLENINEKCTLILRAPILNLQKSHWLHHHAKTLSIQVFPLQDTAHKQWIEAKCRAHHLQGEKEMIDHIFLHTQGNLLASAQCIEKLSVAFSESDFITNEQLQDYLSDQRHYDIYELATACLQAETQKALHLLYQSRLDQTEPTLLLWIVCQEIRQLIKLKTLMDSEGLSPAAACAKLSIWSSRVPLYSSATKRFTLPRLHILLQRCKTMDESIKTSALHLFWEQLDSMILELTCKKALSLEK